jgi:hypothetical protein
MATQTLSSTMGMNVLLSSLGSFSQAGRWFGGSAVVAKERQSPPPSVMVVASILETVTTVAQAPSEEAHGAISQLASIAVPEDARETHDQVPPGGMLGKHRDGAGSSSAEAVRKRPRPTKAQ